MTDASAPRIEGFEYVRFLGEGGQARVYQYRQISPQRAVAVKVMRDSFASEEARRAFLSEADTLASLEHPHIMTIHQAGETTEKCPYLVVKYFPEENLADLAARETLRLAEVLRIAINVASAVDFAHDAGVLHCDIKPQNVLLDAFGSPALGDFGIAARSRRKSRDASFSMRWAPPESFADGELTVASDIYSLGATIWYLLVGSPPFASSESGDPDELVNEILHSDVPPMTRSDVPAELESLLIKMLAKSPAARPSSAREVVLELKDIEKLLGFRPTAVPAVQYSEESEARRLNIRVDSAEALVDQRLSDQTVMRPAAVDHAHVRVDPPSTATTRDAPAVKINRVRRRLVAIGVMAAVLVGAAAGAVVVLRDDEAPAGPPSQGDRIPGLRKPASEVARVLPLDSAPSEVTTDGTHVYVVSGDAGTVTSLSIKGDRIIDTWRPTVGSFSIVADSAARRLYLTDLGGDKALALSTESGKSESSAEVGKEPFRSVLDVGAARLYVSNGGDGSVSVIDTRSFRNVATVRVGDGPAGMALDSEAGLVYVANRRSGTVSVIDSVTARVIKTIPTGNWPFRVTADPKGGRAFVMNAHSDTVSVIDSSSLRVTATLHPGRGPVGGVIDQAADVLYVTLADDNSVAQMSLRDLSLGPSIAVGDGPTGITLDPKTGRVFVVNRDSHDMSVLER